MNSYAWDTAILYIQEAGNTNYANQTSKNSTLSNTGSNNDEVCKINDMASNLVEWSTECSNGIHDGLLFPCTARGGNYNNSERHASSRYDGATSAHDFNGFRLCLYIE